MKKLVYLLSCLFLLSAGFTACSSDYDNPPEQPNSHQNETPTDSTMVNNDTTDIDSTEAYTVISAVPVSEEVKAFFNESLPYYCDSIIIGGGLQIGDFHLDHPEDLWTYNIIRDQESFESNYTGNKPLPHINFNKYILIYGRYFLGSEEIIDSISIHITNNQSSIVLHTTNISTVYSGIDERLRSFWAVFPKDMPEISGVYIDRRKALSIKPVEVNNTVKAFFDEVLPYFPNLPLELSPFSFSPNMESEFFVLNSEQELRDVYKGEKHLPQLDFEQNTLIIGQMLMPGASFYLESVELRVYDDRNVLAIYTREPPYLYSTLYNLYFWGLFPKIENNISDLIQINRKEESVE